MEEETSAPSSRLSSFRSLQRLSDVSSFGSRSQAGRGSGGSPPSPGFQVVGPPQETCPSRTALVLLGLRTLAPAHFKRSFQLGLKAAGQWKRCRKSLGTNRRRSPLSSLPAPLAWMLAAVLGPKAPSFSPNEPEIVRPDLSPHPQTWPAPPAPT